MSEYTLLLHILTENEVVLFSESFSYKLNMVGLLAMHVILIFVFSIKYKNQRSMNYNIH